MNIITKFDQFSLQAVKIMFASPRDRRVAPVDCDKFGDDDKFIVNGLLDESHGFPYGSDFVPGYYHTEFTQELNNIHNRITFLPIHRDRLVIFSSLLRYFDLNEK